MSKEELGMNNKDFEILQGVGEGMRWLRQFVGINGGLALFNGR